MNLFLLLLVQIFAPLFILFYEIASVTYIWEKNSKYFRLTIKMYLIDA